MQRPRSALVEPALDQERALIRIIRELYVKARNGIRQNERLSNLQILDNERSTLEELHACFQRHVDKRRGGKHDQILDLVILQKGHVPAIEPCDPGWRGPRQSDVEQSTAPRTQTALAPIAGLMPPTALLPSVGRQWNQPPRWCHLRKIQRDTGAMQLHRGLEQGFVLAFPACGTH